MVIYRRVLVMVIVAMLVFPMSGFRVQNFTIQESTQALAQPAQLWNGFIKREWQPFLKQRLLIHMGSLRSFFVLSYNETKHRLFPTRPNNSYIWAPEIGYYPVDTIRRLNTDAFHQEAVRQHYQGAARRLRILQELLKHRGVAMLVVTPPPKARIYPEYVAPYLLVPAATIMNQTVFYGDVLEEGGVQTLNVRRIFADKKASSRWPFFTTTSFHWSIWAGCTVADEIMRKGEALTERQFFRIDCSDVNYGKSKLSDTDIASILNIFSTDAIIGQAPFPKIVPQKSSLSTPLKIMVVGDRFSDQITSALTKALPEADWSSDWLTMIDLRSSARQRFRIDGEKTPVEIVQKDSILPEILTKDLLIVEVSDGHTFSNGNLDRLEFELTRSLLGGFLLDANGGTVDPKNFLLNGWSAVRHQLWRTTGSSVSFVLRSDG